MSECRECAKGFAISKALAYTIKRGYHEEKEDYKGLKMIVCKDLLEEMFFGDFNWDNRRGITFAFTKEQWEKIKNWWDDIAPMCNYQIYRGHHFDDMKCLLKDTMWSAIGFPIQVVMIDGLVQFDVITVYIEVGKNLKVHDITVGMVREKVWEQWGEDLALEGWNAHDVFFKFFTHLTLDHFDFVEPNTPLLGLDEDEVIGARLYEECQRLQVKLIEPEDDDDDDDSEEESNEDSEEDSEFEHGNLGMIWYNDLGFALLPAHFDVGTKVGDIIALAVQSYHSDNSIPVNDDATKFYLVQYQGLSEVELSMDHLMEDYMEDINRGNNRFHLCFRAEVDELVYVNFQGQMLHFSPSKFWSMGFRHVFIEVMVYHQVQNIQIENYRLVSNGVLNCYNDDIANIFPSIEDLFGVNFTLIHFPPELHLVLEFEEGKREITIIEPETRVCDLLERIADVRDGIEPSDLRITYQGKDVEDTDTMFQVFPKDITDPFVLREFVVKLRGLGGGKRGRYEDVENMARGVVMGITDGNAFKQPAMAYSNGILDQTGHFFKDKIALMRKDELDKLYDAYNSSTSTSFEKIVSTIAPHIEPYYNHLQKTIDDAKEAQDALISALSCCYVKEFANEKGKCQHKVFENLMDDQDNKLDRDAQIQEEIDRRLREMAVE